MEPHEHVESVVAVLALDLLFVHVVRHGVVDVQQRRGLFRGAADDVFAERAVDIHLAGRRDQAADEAGVHIARHKAELRLERRPALVGERHILRRAKVLLRPVHKRQLELRKLRQNPRHLVAGAELTRHVGHHVLDAAVARMGVEAGEHVELGVLLTSTPRSYSGLIGALQARKSKGRGPNVMILRFLRPSMILATGMKSADHRGDLVGRPHGVFGNERREARSGRCCRRR